MTDEGTKLALLYLDADDVVTPNADMAPAQHVHLHREL
jgi:hypothetical protein